MFNFSNVSLQRGNKLLFRNASITIFAGQKLGLIGANGSGKSSLFGLIRGDYTSDQGEVSVSRHLVIGHLAQQVSTSDEAGIEYVIDGD